MLIPYNMYYSSTKNSLSELLGQLEMRQKVAIDNFKKEICPSCINYKNLGCKNSFDNEGNCWFYESKEKI